MNMSTLTVGSEKAIQTDTSIVQLKKAIRTDKDKDFCFLYPGRR